jgi:hypothetical protein
MLIASLSLRDRLLNAFWSISFCSLFFSFFLVLPWRCCGGGGGMSSASVIMPLLRPGLRLSAARTGVPESICVILYDSISRSSVRCSESPRDFSLSHWARSDQPLEKAWSEGVWLKESATAIAHPCRTSSSTTASLPAAHARCSGVRLPLVVGVSGLAPRASSTGTSACRLYLR